ncbi:MAG: hypothetical protein WCV59_02480 [Parcubacteria group bacterium]
MKFAKVIFFIFLAGFIILAFFIFKNKIYPTSENVTVNKNLTDNNTTSEKDITPTNMNGVRPDVVKIGDSFYVNFLETKPKRSLGMIRVDANLSAQYLGEIYFGSNGSNVTDARMATSDNENFWYPFETVTFNPDKNYLNLARYNVLDQGVQIIDHKDKVAEGIVVNPATGKISPAGSEQTDDPLPSYYDGKYYVMTRTFQSPIYKVRVFDSSLNMIDNYSLDLSSVIGQNAVSVNSLVKIEDDLYIITGVFNKLPPGDPGAISKIIAIPFQNDLKKAKGAKIDLTDGEKYASYVSSAKYKDGKLYVLHNNYIGKAADTIHEGVLEIYDVKNNFALVKTIPINGGKMIDNHMTMEFMGDKLYVFYNTPEEKLKVKTFDISEISR